MPAMFCFCSLYRYFLFFHILSYLFRRGKRLTIKILYKALCDSVNDTSIQWSNSIDAKWKHRVINPPSLRSTSLQVPVSYRIASHRIESKSHRIVSYRIVSWQTLWYRQISYHRPKNQYNIVTQSSKCFYTSKLYFCWSLIFFFSLVTALCSCSVWARQRIPENVNTILPRSQRMETGINSAT